MSRETRKFKVGDRVRASSRCTSSRLSGPLTVTSVEFDCVELVDREGREDWCSGQHLGWATTTLDTLAVDDVVVNDDGHEYTVAGVAGRMVFLEDGNGHRAGVWTSKQLNDCDFAVKQPDEPATEVTMDEVAKALGVSVDKLKIKKD